MKYYSIRKLKKLSRSQREEILAAFEKILADPHRFKPLKYELKGYYRSRIGKYRIIYRIVEDELIVIVVAIDHRKKVYRDK